VNHRCFVSPAAAGALALALAWAAPASAQTTTVAQGPMIGAVASNTATVWVRISAPGSVRVRYRVAKSSDWAFSAPVVTGSDADDTAKFALPALQAGSVYFYQVGITGDDGVETWTGAYNFVTQAATVNAVSFAVLSDFSNKLKSSRALRDALSHKPDFLAVIGDLDHRNPASSRKGGVYPIEDAPLVLADLRAMHRDTRDFATPIGNDFATGLIGKPGTGRLQIPLYYGWDDHDFCMNNADDQCPFAPEAVQAAREYYVTASDNGLDGSLGCPQSSTFQRIDYGQLLSVFILDARSARDDSQATTLGACQFNWLTSRLASSHSLWKVILTPVPFNPTIKTWDAWGKYPSERGRLVDFLHQNDIRNLVFMSGDVHSGGAIDDGTHSGWPELSVPHANMPKTWINTFCEIADGHTLARSEPGLWTIGSLTEPDFDTPPRPTCSGDRIDPGTQLIYPPVGVYASSGKGQPGYVRVEATSTSFTASVVGADGKIRSGQQADGRFVPMTVQLTAQ
jgi:alkaline phosphatase D